MSIKSFFKMLFTFILIFALIANTIFTVLICTRGGSFFGYEFSSSTEKAYINALLLGVDKEGYRTDVIILAQLNLVDKELNMLQIPRDTYIKNNRADHKINSAYGYGKEKQVFKEVRMLTGVDVDKYILIDTAGFRDLIDTIGGVDFNVPINMNYDDPVQDLHIHLTKGQQHLDGSKAEQFVRFRKNNDGTGYAMGDIERMKAQSKFIQATIDEIFNLVNVFKLNDLVKSFRKLVRTNFTMNEMLTYAPYVFSIDRDKMLTYQLPGVADYINGISYFKADTIDLDDMIDKHFTPSSETVTESELEIQNNIVGLNASLAETGDVKMTRSILNSFTSVDIVDASGGKADVDEIKDKLKKYGFNIKRVTSTGDVTYPETCVASKHKMPRAGQVAAMCKLNSYFVNREKATGTDVTIIIGTDCETGGE